MASSKKSKNTPEIPHQTGPRTAEGKANSSQNATTHGCRSLKHRILEGESENEFLALRARWFDEYGPAHEIDKEMLERVVEAHWRMLRNERQLTETEAAIQATKSLLEWTDTDHKLIQLARRYYREALSFYNAARRDLDNMRLTRQREIQEVDRAGKSIESIAIRRHSQRVANEAEKASARKTEETPASEMDSKEEIHARELRRGISSDNKQPSL